MIGDWHHDTPVRDQRWCKRAMAMLHVPIEATTRSMTLLTTCAKANAALMIRICAFT